MRFKDAPIVRKKFLTVAIAALSIVAMLATDGPAQTRPNLLITRLIYNSLKAQAKPEGALKEALDSLEKDVAQAAGAGRESEIRRLLAKGIALLQKKEWTDELDFANSLVMRAEEICLDSSRPAVVRLEQTYAPRLHLKSSLTARVSLHKPEQNAFEAQPGEKIKDLLTLEGLGRDLLDKPSRIELDLADFEDGTYFLRVEALEQETSLGAASLLIDLRRGLSDRLRALEAGAAGISSFNGLRAEALYPVDRIRNVNRGLIALGGFRVETELKSAEVALASLKAGRDPFSGRTGDMERHYRLEGAEEILPYRVYVPSKYDGKKAFPLIIALHGLGADQGSFFDGYGKRLPKLAEEHGYIVGAPLGYRVDGFYGMNIYGLMGGGDDPGQKRKLEYSEKDVFCVLDLMRKEYKIDDSRIYLMGHSMGAIGTWHLGAKHPQIWAALAPFSGYGIPATAAALKGIPEIIVHGDADLTVPVGGSRGMVAELKRLGTEHRYIEVPGGNHINVVEPNLAAVVDFFDKHRKKTP